MNSSLDIFKSPSFLVNVLTFSFNSSSEPDVGVSSKSSTALVVLPSAVSSILLADTSSSCVSLKSCEPITAPCSFVVNKSTFRFNSSIEPAVRASDASPPPSSPPSVSGTASVVEAYFVKSKSFSFSCSSILLKVISLIASASFRYIFSSLKFSFAAPLVTLLESSTTSCMRCIIISRSRTALSSSASSPNSRSPSSAKAFSK